MFRYDAMPLLELLHIPGPGRNPQWSSKMSSGTLILFIYAGASGLL